MNPNPPLGYSVWQFCGLAKRVRCCLGLIAIGAIGTISATLPTLASPSSPYLSAELCNKLGSNEPLTEIEAALREAGIEPQQRVIAIGLAEWNWTDQTTGAFFNVVLRQNQIEQTTCQPSPPRSATTPIQTAHRLCSQVQMGMTLEAVQQALATPGEALDFGENAPPGMVWQWVDVETQQMALFSFSNFGELVGMSCFRPVEAIATDETSSQQMINRQPQLAASEIRE